MKFRLLFFFLFLRNFQQSTRRQYQGPLPSHPTVFKGPERNLAAGNLDPLRARRRPRRLGICAVMLSACTLSLHCMHSFSLLSFFVCFCSLHLFILLTLYAPRRLRQATAPGPRIECLSFVQSFFHIVFWIAFVVDLS